MIVSSGVFFLGIIQLGLGGFAVYSAKNYKKIERIVLGVLAINFLVVGLILLMLK